MIFYVSKEPFDWATGGRALSVAEEKILRRLLLHEKGYPCRARPPALKPEEPADPENVPRKEYDRE